MEIITHVKTWPSWEVDLMNSAHVEPPFKTNPNSSALKALFSQWWWCWWSELTQKSVQVTPKIATIMREWLTEVSWKSRLERREHYERQMSSPTTAQSKPADGARRVLALASPCQYFRESKTLPPQPASGGLLGNQRARTNKMLLR